MKIIHTLCSYMLKSSNGDIDMEISSTKKQTNTLKVPVKFSMAAEHSVVHFLKIQLWIQVSIFGYLITFQMCRKNLMPVFSWHLPNVRMIFNSNMPLELSGIKRVYMKKYGLDTFSQVCPNIKIQLNQWRAIKDLLFFFDDRFLSLRL